MTKTQFNTIKNEVGKAIKDNNAQGFDQVLLIGLDGYGYPVTDLHYVFMTSDTDYVFKQAVASIKKNGLSIGDFAISSMDEINRIEWRVYANDDKPNGYEVVRYVH